MSGTFAMRGLGAAAALSLLAMTAAPNASAATFTSCVGTGYDISGKVSGATGCTIGSQAQDFLNSNPMTVNEPPGFFNFTDWVFLDKDDPPTGGVQSGTYNVGTALSNYSTVMLIFKSGKGTTLVGYTVDEATGSWNSPFIEPPFDFPGKGPKDVSHISYYGRGEIDPPPPPPIDPIPEPMSLALFGLGLAGLGVARRRKATA